MTPAERQAVREETLREVREVLVRACARWQGGDRLFLDGSACALFEFDYHVSRLADPAVPPVPEAPSEEFPVLPLAFDRKPWTCRCNREHAATDEGPCRGCTDYPPWPPVAFERKWNASEAPAVEVKREDGGGLLGLRAAGWSVAVHNDYHLNGKAMTFWLFTHPSGRWVKGEGATDREALDAAAAAAGLAQPPPLATEGKREGVVPPRAGDVWRSGSFDYIATGERVPWAPKQWGLRMLLGDGSAGATLHGRYEKAFTDGTLTFVRSTPREPGPGGEGTGRL